AGGQLRQRLAVGRVPVPANEVVLAEAALVAVAVLGGLPVLAEQVVVAPARLKPAVVSFEILRPQEEGGEGAGGGWRGGAGRKECGAAEQENAEGYAPKGKGRQRSPPPDLSATGMPTASNFRRTRDFSSHSKYKQRDPAGSKGALYLLQGRDVSRCRAAMLDP